MTIAEVAKKYQLTTDTLRYYERIGLLPQVTRTSGGIRNYGESDCGWVEFIKCMRNAGIPIEVLIEYVGLFKYGDATVLERKNLLIEQRNILLDKIAELNAVADRLNYKIDHYIEHNIKQKELINHE